MDIKSFAEANKSCTLTKPMLDEAIAEMKTLGYRVLSGKVVTHEMSGNPASEPVDAKRWYIFRPGQTKRGGGSGSRTQGQAWQTVFSIAGIL